MKTLKTIIKWAATSAVFSVIAVAGWEVVGRDVMVAAPKQEVATTTTPTMNERIESILKSPEAYEWAELQYIEREMERLELRKNELSKP